MKKIFITAATVALFSVSVFADGSKKANVSSNVTSQFEANFIDAKNVTWSVDKDFQKADFILNGVKATAFYNHDGDFVALTEDVDAKAVPAKVKAEIAAKYKGFDINGVIIIQNNTDLNPEADETAYFVDLKSADKELLMKITPSLHLQLAKEIK
ncbi:MAG TPA: hypothetical protein VHC47_06500 [Mucilaginibacter sp.]|nr:hypothetical protein [Mucilaginibacter sp.]